MPTSMSYLKSELLLRLNLDRWNNPHPKRSFWCTDGLKPAIDIYLRWIDEPETNPIAPETLLMFRAADAFEFYIIQTMARIGEAVDITDKAEIERLGLSVVERNANLPQIRVEMEREYVQISGYLDGVTPEGYPIEIKTYYWGDNRFARGCAPNEQYLYQTAMYMDFLGTTKGIIVMANRSNGNLFFYELRREDTDTLLFTLGDRSMAEGNEVADDEESPPKDASEAFGELYEFDLAEEYKRFRQIMEDNIIPLKEPELEHEYRPTVTKELIEFYMGPEKKVDKIKLAIKGKRVLSSDKWRYQYSSYKDKIIEKEMKAKGCASVEELVRYDNSEIRLMMDLARLEHQKTKDGRWKVDASGARKLFKKKGLS